MASYPSAAKSFSTKVDGVDLVQAAHINDIQDEVKAVEDQLIASKLATLTSAPGASKVLTTDGSGAPTWEAAANFAKQSNTPSGAQVLTSVAGTPTWAAKAPDADKLGGVDSSLYARQNAAPSGNQVLTSVAGAPTWAVPSWTTLTAPTFDLTIIDNGSGGQPTLNRYCYFVLGKFCTVNISISGYKVGTNSAAAMFNNNAPSAAYSNMRGIGIVNAYWAGFNWIGAVDIVAGNVYFNGHTGNNISDNQQIIGLSATYTYEIA